MECPRCHGEGSLAVTERVTVTCPTCDGACSAPEYPADPQIEALRDQLLGLAAQLDAVVAALDDYVRANCPACIQRPEARVIRLDNPRRRG